MKIAYILLSLVAAAESKKAGVRKLQECKTCEVPTGVRIKWDVDDGAWETNPGEGNKDCITDTGLPGADGSLYATVVPAAEPGSYEITLLDKPGQHCYFDKSVHKAGKAECVLGEFESCATSVVHVPATFGISHVELVVHCCDESEFFPPQGGGGSFGDPHLKTWQGHRYDYHGECDLVLVHSDKFADGAGLDIHIRTEIRKDWSYIESAALRIGEEVLEMESKGVYYLNGEPFADMPATIHGFPITYEITDEGRSQLVVGLGNRKLIRFREFKDFVSVKINEGSAELFGDATGMMGDFEGGKMIARDGQTIKDDPNEFGQEWQVRVNEPKLFKDVKGPQFPQQCRLPDAAAKTGRRLASTVSYEDAVKACAEWGTTEREGCVYDVMATGDLAMGEADAF